MTTFALITEGITDQAILENILDCLTKKQAIINPLRPLRDETDNSRVAKNEYSNWELVFEFIASEEILNAIQTNDFIVIQLDTDQCEHQNFGVSLDTQGTPKSIEEIIDNCISVIKNKFHASFPISELNRVIFAIPVLSSECWLISLHDQQKNHTRKTINNCNQRLSNLLSSKNIPLKKDYHTYSNLSKKFRNNKMLITSANKTPCLKIFIDQIIVSDSCRHTDNALTC